MKKTQILSGLTSIMLLSAVFTTPALADSDIRIAGNGSRSDNNVRVQNNRDVTVRQTNDTNISNTVSVNNNTGHNSASGNTGGDVNVHTGNATATVNISNQAGSNVANISGCCTGNSADIKIEGNGSRSDNSVDLTKRSDFTLIQNNTTNITNNVTVQNNTGYNSVDGNTRGDVTLSTGDADANVSIHNEAGKNVANIEGCCVGDDTDIVISGNGSKSDNAVRVTSDNDTTIRQNNDTDIDNDVNVRNNTGYNDVEGSDKYHKKSYKGHDYDTDKKDHKKDDHKKKDDDRSKKFWPKHDDKKYEDKKDDHDKKNRDYDHDKISYDWYKKYTDHHDSYKKDYDKDGHKKADKKYYFVTKYDKYDNDHKSYDKDHHDKDKYDHEKKYYPVKKVDSDRCDYKHWDSYSWKDWVWFKDNCNHDKKFVHPVVYYNYHDMKDHKKYDRDHKKHDSDHYKKVTYKKDDHKKDHDSKKYDHGKRHDGNKYVLAKYPKYVKNHDRDYCGTDKSRSYNPWRSHSLNKYHGGNTGGDVTIRTGDARSNVNLHNLGSSNYLNFN